MKVKENNYVEMSSKVLNSLMFFKTQLNFISRITCCVCFQTSCSGPDLLSMVKKRERLLQNLGE